jgi:hypothetical protein
MSDKSDRTTPGRAWDLAAFHDAFCETHGHDACCPPTEAIPADAGVLRDPKTGQLMKGTKPANRRIMPGRLKDARKFIAKATNNGETLLVRLLYLTGAHPELGRQQDILPTGPVQVRALRELREIFYGRAIHLEGKVGVQIGGEVKHEHTHRLADPGDVPVEVLTDDELAQLRSMSERVKALPPAPEKIAREPGQDIADAEWEEVVGGSRPTDGDDR